MQITLSNSQQIHYEYTVMGKDINISIFGGDTPHIGCTVMSVARPSLTGEGISATSSVLCCAGHKDEIIARTVAEAIASKKNCTAVCTCGIHIDNISKTMLTEINDCCEQIIHHILINE